MMSGQSTRPLRALNLNDIVDELERCEDDDLLPTQITIFPPENANADVTDEDSGAEEFVALQNLPGSQLRAPAEVTFHMSSDEEDDVPLSSLSKRRRTMDLTLEDSDVVPSCSSDVSTNSTFVQPTVPRNQSYRWKNRHIPNHFNQWNDEQGQRNKVGKVTVSEMKCFLGILMYSGYVVVLRRFMYWETSTDADFRIVHNAMSRDRFTFIISNLYCCDNTVLGDSPDKFAKLRPLFDELNKIFTEMAPLEENYSIDEAMVPYYGRHSCKQFIRGKPIRWGYKLWVGATRLGYVIWFDPYQGKSSTIAEGYKQFGLGGSVILEFADVLQGRDPTLRFHLFFDNYFSSIPLLHELSNRGLRATELFVKTERPSVLSSLTKISKILIEVHLNSNPVCLPIFWFASGMTIVSLLLPRILKLWSPCKKSRDFRKN
ncbi:unnamed protein product [Parnassius apollo]|uniref:(apollo) hypothetical protein n=1 Tax=Parnassius apollo TaxID=110799 RepID=A0A8S3W2R1_PARAO|nr:unnamed protein product [Parnassius apollo]